MSVLNALRGKDNFTYDVVRIQSAVAFAIALCLQVYVVIWKSQPFDMQSFGIGLGVLVGSVGAALKLKESTEPDLSPSTVTTSTTTTKETT